MNLGGLRAAIAFLTIVPVGGSGSSATRLGRGFFPAVGAAVGLVSGATYFAAGLRLPSTLAALAAIAAGAVLTGALHLDGLADAADGLLGGRTVERRLEIMRDSRIGSFGAVAVVLVLVGDVAALASLSPARAVAALVAAGALSRLGLVALLGYVPYARREGLGAAAAGRLSALEMAVAVGAAAVACIPGFPRSLIATLLAGVAAAAVGLLAVRRIGGATGDVYGASTELSTLAVLAVFAAR